MTPAHTQKNHQEIEETKISGLMKRPGKKCLFFLLSLMIKEFHYNGLTHREKNKMKITDKEKK